MEGDHACLNHVQGVDKVRPDPEHATSTSWTCRVHPLDMELIREFSGNCSEKGEALPASRARHSLRSAPMKRVHPRTKIRWAARSAVVA